MNSNMVSKVNLTAYGCDSGVDYVTVSRRKMHCNYYFRI